jgi:hypothetical protein
MAPNGDVLDSGREGLFLVLLQPSARLPDASDSGRGRFPPVRGLLVIVA